VEEGLTQHIYVIDKDKDGNVSREKLYGVRYVPLVSSDK
jgi:protein-L-isoaspartate(D-aspartate) O-methyltransferase